MDNCIYLDFQNANIANFVFLFLVSFLLRSKADDLFLSHYKMSNGSLYVLTHT